MSADDCFHNNNIIVSIILVLLHIGRKISESFFLNFYLIFFFQKILHVNTIVNIIIKVIIILTK